MRVSNMADAALGQLPCDNATFAQLVSVPIRAGISVADNYRCTNCDQLYV